VSTFLAMGGYAAFVWPAYAVSLLGLGAAIGISLAQYRRARARLARLEAGGA